MATYRRKIILINKPFQIRFCLYVCGWLLGICFIYPLIVSNLFEYFIRYAAADPNGPAVSTLYQTRREVLTLLGVTEIAFLILTFLITLFISHRIAGPLFKLRKTFDEFGKGIFPQDRVLTFRKKDYFPELADDFNLMLNNLKNRASQESQILATAAARIEGVLKNAPAESRSELELALISIRKIQEQKSAPSAAT